MTFSQLRVGAKFTLFHKDMRTRKSVVWKKLAPKKKGKYRINAVAEDGTETAFLETRLVKGIK